MKMKKISAAVALAGLAAVSLASCGGNESPSQKNARLVKAAGTSAENDTQLYEAALSDYSATYAEAKTKTSISEKFAYMAKAEAQLLASGVFLPTTTSGGNYAFTAVAPRTAPFALWGTDEYRYKNLVVATDLIKASDRAAMLENYQAKKGTEGYDHNAYAAEYLKGKGYTLQDTYTLTYSEGTATWDWLATSMASDSEVLVNLVDGLVEYNGENELVPALAEALPTKTKNADGTVTYTFKIRQNVFWAKASDGTKTTYPVTAHDFVTGFQHMLDAAGGLEYLVEGVIVNASEYLYGEITDFSKVGVKAVDDYTLTYTTCSDLSYFETYLSYNIFQPLNKDYFLSQGGALGRAEYAAAAASTSYTYGVSKDNVLTCGAYYMDKYQDNGEVLFKANTNYWAAVDTDTTNDPTIKQIKWIYNDGSDTLAAYKYAKNGDTDGAGLNTTAIEQAKADGLFDEYSYVTDTVATTYFAANNLNRQTYVLSNGGVETNKNEKQVKATHIAMNNQNFRLALNRAFDKATYNAQSVGDTLKLNSLRNMYTPYNFCSTTEAVTIDGKSFAANTDYGVMVEYFLEQEGLVDVNLQDGNNSWYNPTESVKYMEAAMAEIGSEIGSDKIQIDIFYYSGSSNQTKQANAYKNSVEGVLGQWVQVNLVSATTTDDYYASGYRAANGAAGNYDVFYGSGWGPDYGDPSTYLDTFLPEGGGYMTKVIGLW